MEAPATLRLDAALPHLTVLPTAWYSVLGVTVSVASDVVEALHCVDITYAAFRRAPSPSGAAIRLQLRRLKDGLAYEVSDAEGYEQCWSEQHLALLDLLDHLVHALLAQLQPLGLYAIHAAAAVYRGQALILAGRSGFGKTTLMLGLLHRGLPFLSDELAVVEQATQRILPYHRSLHIRPGTLDLIPELHVHKPLPRCALGGGNEWVLAPEELDQLLPGCLGVGAPLRYVLLLDEPPRVADAPTITPVPAALAGLELLRNTWTTSLDFEGGLSRIADVLNGVHCARLQAGTLEATLQQVVRWLEANCD